MKIKADKIVVKGDPGLRKAPASKNLKLLKAKADLKQKAQRFLKSEDSDAVKLSNRGKVDRKKVSKPTKTISKGKPLKTSNAFGISPQTINQAVKALNALSDEWKKGAKKLIDNDDKVFLHISLLKVPTIEQQRRRYLQLAHGCYKDDPEVCLFVGNVHTEEKLTPDERIERSVEHYESILKHYGVSGITAVMPLFQLKTEYDTFELKRKLVNKFDLFLVQSLLMDSTGFQSRLGKAFSSKNKLPIAIPIPKNIKDKSELKTHVSSALKRTWFYLKPHSDLLSVRVGSTGQSSEALQENIAQVILQLSGKSQGEDIIPGGIQNVRSLSIKTSLSKSIPLYMSLASKSSVSVPVVKSRRPAIETVEDELSTMPGKRVAVLPSGDVFVTTDENEKLPPGWSDGEEDEGMNFDSESEDGEAEVEEKNESSDEESKAPKKSRKRKQETVKKEDSEDSEDEEAEAAEQNYLTKLSNKEESDEEDEEKDEKPAKKGKKKQKNVKKNVPKSQKKEAAQQVKQKAKKGKKGK